MLKNLLSLTIGVVLLAVVMWYVKDSGLWSKVALLPVSVYAVSAAILLALFMLSGVQMRIALLRSGQGALTALDTVALPIAQNFWGYIIPIQGSFIYGATFLKAKYEANVSTTTAVYLFITVCSLVMGAFFGVAHSFVTNIHFMPIYVVIVLMPFWLLVGHRFLRVIDSRISIPPRVKEFIDKVLGSMVIMLRDPLFVMKVIVLDLAYVTLVALWSYYLSESLGFGVPIGIYVLVSFFLKLTIIAKFTPGNIGVIQLFSGGVLAAYGHPLEAGLFISTLQLGLLVVISFPVAIVLTIVQFKYIRRLFFWA